MLGTILVTQQFIPHFKARRAGVIMTTTSLAAIIALPRDGVCVAAKFQTPINDLTGYEQPAINQRKYLLDGNAEFPEPTDVEEFKVYLYKKFFEAE